MEARPQGWGFFILKLLTTACAVTLLAVGVGVGLTPAAGAGAPAAQGGGHDAFNFVDPNTLDRTDTYRTVEGDVTFQVAVARGQHGVGPASVDLTASLGSATAEDFEPFTDRRLTFEDPIETQYVDLLTKHDAPPVPESLKTVNLELSNPSSGAVLAFPRNAVLTIVDDDGLSSRVSFEFASYSGFENRGSLLVRVLRSGDAASDASVKVATVPTAGDTAAVPGQDYVHTEKMITFGAGGRGLYGGGSVMTIPLLNDSAYEGTERFSLVLSDPMGAELMSPSTVEVALLDDDSPSTADTIPPYTAFHQPLHGRTYAARNLKQFIVFMQDNNNGSGMDRVQLAIRKNLSNGRCSWWTGSGFVRRACDAKRWSNTPADEYSETTVFSLGTKLKPSTRGSGIKDYTAFSRGWDNVGNKQTRFDKGQNKNTFEIK
ncbi:MAG: hypothetical protein M3391_12135 [Actinomycetota bacterium]|nr:hypothetical protein [Actinomycetota bacterium]